MAHIVSMPKFGLTMTEGTVTNWFKSVGEYVNKGDLLYEVQTDKITNEVEASHAGILRHLFVPAGSLAQVGESLAIIADEQENITAYLEGKEKETAEIPAQGIQASHTAGSLQQNEGEDCSALADGFVRATPLARKLAREQGIPLEEWLPSGPGGIVVARDIVKKESESPAISPLAKKYAKEHGVEWKAIQQRNRIMLPDVIAEQQRASGAWGEKADKQQSESVAIPLAGMRKVIAQRMTQSRQQIPHVTITREVDVTRLLAVNESLSHEAAQSGCKVTLTHWMIMLAAKALKQHPVLNAWCQNQELIYHRAVHMGVAVDAEEGLMVPVIRDADRLGLVQIAEALQDLSSRARERRLTVDELGGSTFTISNLGMMQVDQFTPIINPPETGILGIGRIVDRPVFAGEEVVKRSFLPLSLSFDHRALDGAEAARFLQTIASYAEEPLRLLLKGEKGT